MMPDGDEVASSATQERPKEGVEEAVVVRVRGSELGIPVRHVTEVIRVPPITRIPFPPPAVLGVVAVHNAVLAAIDLGERLFGQPADRNGRMVIALAAGGGERLALLVDEVSGMVPIDRIVDTPPPEVVDSLPEGWIQAVLAPTEDRLIALLDLGLVLHQENEAEE